MPVAAAGEQEREKAMSSVEASAESQASDLVTYEEAAELLGISYRGVKHAVQHGGLSPVRFTGSTRKYFHRADVLAYRTPTGRRLIKERHQEPAPSTVAPGDLLRIVDSLWESGDEALHEANQNLGSQLQEANQNLGSQLIGQRIAIIHALLGNGGAFTDPKAFARLSIA